MADANPGPNEEWRNYIVNDPYLVPAAPPVGNPFAQADIPVVILDEEDDSGEESEEYTPYGYPEEHDSDSDTVEDEILPPPTPVVPPPRDAPTMDQHYRVADRVLQLGDRVAADSDALQSLYSRVGIGHSNTNTAEAHIRALQYRLEVAERELRSSERERLQIRSQLTELTRFVRRRIG